MRLFDLSIPAGPQPTAAPHPAYATLPDPSMSKNIAGVRPLLVAISEDRVPVALTTQSANDGCPDEDNGVTVDYYGGLALDIELRPSSGPSGPGCPPTVELKRLSISLKSRPVALVPNVSGCHYSVGALDIKGNGNDPDLPGLNSMLTGISAQVLFGLHFPDRPRTYRIALKQNGNTIASITGGPSTPLSNVTFADNAGYFFVPGYTYKGDIASGLETLMDHYRGYANLAAANAVRNRPKELTVSAYNFIPGLPVNAPIDLMIPALAQLGFNSMGINIGALVDLPAGSKAAAVGQYVEDSLTNSGIKGRVLASNIIGAEPNPWTPFRSFCVRSKSCEDLVLRDLKRLHLFGAASIYPAPKSTVREIHVWDEPGWNFPDVFSLLPKGNATGRAQATDTAPLADRQRFVDTMEFFLEEASDQLSSYAISIHRSYPEAHTSYNWQAFPSIAGKTYLQAAARSDGAPLKNDDYGTQKMDWALSASKEGYGLWTEDSFSDALAEQWSFQAALLRSASLRRPPPGAGPKWVAQRQPIGGYVIGSALSSIEGASYKALALAGQGGKVFDFYSFGPQHFWNSVNTWSENPQAFGAIAGAIERLGKADHLLAFATPSSNKIAIQLPGASAQWARPQPKLRPPVWELYSLEGMGLYYALEHSGYQTDLIGDRELSDKKLLTLEKYKVLYLTSLNMSCDSVDGVERWVHFGGTLVVTAGAGLWNQFNEPTTSPQAKCKSSLTRLLGLS